MRFLNFLMGSMLLMDEAGKDTGGGGGNDSAKALKDLQDQNAKLIARLDALEKGKDDGKGKNDDPSLSENAKKEREAAEAASKKEKSLESALNFNISSKEFLKNNGHLLPKTVEGIFTAAEKKNYDSAVDKANELKVGIFEEFFAVQANHDQLTGPQKIEVDNFIKLTNNVKKDRIEQVYSMIFEPMLESVRKQAKAKELNTGSKNQTDGEKALAERMMKNSKKHYLGEK